MGEFASFSYDILHYTVHHVSNPVFSGYKFATILMISITS